jgi:deoxyadenosine/deoxycytidine kinase
MNNMGFKIVSIEGNIGSGKSTLLENLRNHYKENTKVVFLKEPVDEWDKIRDKDGDTMLSKFYADQEKYSFSFQMMAYISRLKILRDTVKMNKDNDVIIITERSLFTDKYVFAKMLYEQGKIEDVCYQIYLNWFDEFAQDFPITHTVYVNAEPQICYERIHLRARIGEELIPISYLEDCHKYHEEFISNIKSDILILNGNSDIYKNENIINEWLSDIDDFVS